MYMHISKKTQLNRYVNLLVISKIILLKYPVPQQVNIFVFSFLKFHFSYVQSKALIKSQKKIKSIEMIIPN